MKNVFDQNDVSHIIQRINQLQPDTERQWGKMTPAQMLAHCNVTYEMVYENIHPKPGIMTRWLLKMFVKKTVVGDTPTQKFGSARFEGKESHSFGKLTSKEWNNMFYKHLNHHLTQFGV